MAETTEQIVREAPEIEAYKLGLLKSGKSLVESAGANRDKGQYLLPDYKVAGMDPNQVLAIKAGEQGIGAYKPYLQSGAQSLNQGANTMAEAADVLRGSDTRNQYTAAQAAMNQAAQRWNPQSMQQYMDPYQQAVMQQTMGELNRQGQISRQGLASQAAATGALGGSRNAVMRAELERNLQQQRAKTLTDLYSQGYGNALNAFNTDQNRMINVGQGIGSLATNQFNIGNSMAQGLGALGTQSGNLGVQQAALGQTAQGLGQNDTNYLYGLGAQNQKQAQAVLDATRATNTQRAMEPYQQMGWLSDIYKGAPTSQMALSQQAVPAPSPFQQITGLGTGLLATGAAINQASKGFGGLT
jgi:hypothetical protein